MQDYKDKLTALATFEQQMLVKSKEIADLIRAEREAVEPKKEQAAYQVLFDLNDKYASAMEKTGRERMDALEAYIREVSEAAKTSEVVRFGHTDTFFSTETQTALERMQEAQAEWEATKVSISEDMQAAANQSSDALLKIEDALKAAQQEVRFFEENVKSLQAWIENLKARITVEVADDQALAAIDRIQDRLANLRDKTIYVNVVQAGEGVPAFASGTPRVPHDMLAFIHKDEAIIPAGRNPYLSTPTTQNIQNNTGVPVSITINHAPNMGRAELEYMIKRAVTRPGLAIVY